MAYPTAIIAKRATQLSAALLAFGPLALPLSCEAGQLTAVSENSAQGGSATGGGGTGGGGTGGGSPTETLCAVVGEPCVGSRDCCSGACAKSDTVDPQPRCQGVSGCRPAGEYCAHDDECCSRACNADKTGATRCQIGRTDCRESGELCGALATGAVNCCDTTTSPTPVCIPSITGVTRCRKMDPNEQPLVDAAYCTSASECRNHNCLPVASSGNTVCSSTCAALAQPCRAATDCCRDRGNVACVEETCQLTGLACKQLGQPCVSDGECCGETCRNDPGGEGISFCAALP